jgi:hypothetical protein
MTRRYSDADRQRAREVYEAEGLAAAHKATGVPRSTIKGWARAVGWAAPETDTAKNARAQTTAARATLEAKRAEAAHETLDGARALLVDMFAPYTYKHVVPLRLDGEHAGQTVEVVSVEFTAPVPKDRQHLAVALGVLVDKALVLGGSKGDEPLGEPDDEVREVVAKVLNLAEEAARRRA